MSNVSFFTPSERASKWLHAALEQCDRAERIAKQSPIDFDQVNQALSDAAADLQKARMDDDEAETEFKGKRYNAKQVAFRIFVTQGHACTDPSASEEIMRKGIDAYNRALELIPDKEIYHALSQAHLRLDEKAEALAAVERAIRLAPHDVQSRALKNKIEKYQGTTSGEIVVQPFTSTSSKTYENSKPSDKWDLGPWGWLCFAIAVVIFALFLIPLREYVVERINCPVSHYYSDNPRGDPRDDRTQAYCHE